jgi:SAM-dependent methyltransferase
MAAPEYKSKISIVSAFATWWKDHCKQQGRLASCRTLLSELWRFLLDSTPESRRRRYGDVEFDWDYRVDTTSATVGWRDRLLGIFHSPYQATDPALFHEMLRRLDINFPEFTFVDLGSGKGRVLLMAADYPFRRILGIELLPELNRIALENLRNYQTPNQQCFNVQSECGDARNFEFPPEPVVLYLFNPLSQSGLVQMLHNLERSLLQSPRKVFVLYQNPLLEAEFSNCKSLRKVIATVQYCLYASEYNSTAHGK